MAGKTDLERVMDMVNEIRESQKKLKEIILSYFTLGNEFAKSSLITALKSI